MSEVDDNKAELLDDDVVYEEYPPERPLGVDERLTPSEEQVDEPLARRVAREEPDAGETEAEHLGTLVAPGGDEGLDLEGDEVATEVGGPAWNETSALDREEVRAAEEEAMHLTDPPPLGDGDGYIEE
ncbi:MAG TPA: hypothetical protein VM618_03925 [Acidimicrobiia bacterium]|nr:hypothetical protein [Acidimicrobiia bacterium]